MNNEEKIGEGVKFEHDVRHETATEFDEIRGEYKTQSLDNNSDKMSSL